MRGKCIETNENDKLYPLSRFYIFAAPMKNISKTERNALKGHKGLAVWLTGLSGAGKSTIAVELEHQLFAKKIHTYVLDGDVLRTGLNKDLSFTEEARKENIRRTGEVAKLFVDSGTMVIAAFISPFASDRKIVRELLGKEFVEVFVNCPLEVCEQRDVKGLYKKARTGELKNFTGIDSPYEPPQNAELTLNTDVQNVQQCVEQIIEFVMPKIEWK
jgi:adenylylsulfate kinase